MYNRNNQRPNFDSPGYRRYQHGNFDAERYRGNHQPNSNIYGNNGSATNSPNPWLHPEYGTNSNILTRSPVLVDKPQSPLDIARNILNGTTTPHNQRQSSPFHGPRSFSSGGVHYEYNHGQFLYPRDSYGFGSTGLEGRYSGITTGVSSRYRPTNKNIQDNKGKQFEAPQPGRAASVRSQNPNFPKRPKWDPKQVHATKNYTDNRKPNDFTNYRRKKFVPKKEIGKQDQKDICVKTTGSTTGLKEVEKMDVDGSVQEESDKSNEVEKQVETKKEVVLQKKSIYAGIPVALFYCHVCLKHMWDEVSFVMHLRGRIHKLMLQHLEQVNEIKAQFLRKCSYAKEKQKQALWNSRKKRNRKPESNGYCTMCNLNFLGTLADHVRNDKHQRLKRFIHPKCWLCSKKFQTRKEYDEHKLSSDHLMKLTEYRKKKNPNLKDEDNNTLELLDELERSNELEGSNELSIETSEAIKGDADADNPSVDLSTSEMTITHEKSIVKPVVVNEISSEDEEYLFEEVNGFVCNVCNRFFLSEGDKKKHFSTSLHRNSLSYLMHFQIQSKQAQKRNADDMTNSEKVDSPSDDLNEVDRKRIKLNEDGIDVNKDDIEMKTDPEEKFEHKIKVEENNESKVETQDIDGNDGDVVAEKIALVKDFLIVLDDISGIVPKVKKEEKEISKIDEVESQSGNKNVEIEDKTMMEMKEDKDVTTDVSNDGQWEEVQDVMADVSNDDRVEQVKDVTADVSNDDQVEQVNDVTVDVPNDQAEQDKDVTADVSNADQVKQVKDVTVDVSNDDQAEQDKDVTADVSNDDQVEQVKDVTADVSNDDQVKQVKDVTADVSNDDQAEQDKDVTVDVSNDDQVETDKNVKVDVYNNDKVDEANDATSDVSKEDNVKLGEVEIEKKKVEVNSTPPKPKRGRPRGRGRSKNRY